MFSIHCDNHQEVMSRNDCKSVRNVDRTTHCTCSVQMPSCDISIPFAVTIQGIGLYADYQKPKKSGIKAAISFVRGLGGHMACPNAH